MTRDSFQGFLQKRNLNDIYAQPYYWQDVAQSDFLDCQSNLNPSQIGDWQSISKSTFQNWLTIQSNYF